MDQDSDSSDVNPPRAGLSDKDLDKKIEKGVQAAMIKFQGKFHEQVQKQGQSGYTGKTVHKLPVSVKLVDFFILTKKSYPDKSFGFT